MQQCCNDCYRICTPLNDCPLSMFIYVPVGFPGEEIILSITKSGVNARIVQQLEVIAGIVEVELDTLPEGFFNPWAGDYILKFTDPNTQMVLTFTAADGKQYDSVCFSFEKTYSIIATEIIINPYGSNP